LLERITGFPGDLPDLVEGVWADLVRYATALQDDVTMLVLAPGKPEPR
jgi:hypothetical protein